VEPLRVAADRVVGVVAIAIAMSTARLQVAVFQAGVQRSRRLHRREAPGRLPLLPADLAPAAPATAAVAVTMTALRAAVGLRLPLRPAVALPGAAAPRATAVRITTLLTPATRVVVIGIADITKRPSRKLSFPPSAS
jgi:hypothetical protein